eukprot:77483_1
MYRLKFQLRVFGTLEPQTKCTTLWFNSIHHLSVLTHTTSGSFYGIQGRCMDDSLTQWQDWVRVTNSKYLDVYRSNMMPVRRIYKQIIYFDVTRPNQYINDAEWWDATSIYPIPCHTSTYTIFVGHLPANRQPTDNHHIIHIRWAQSHPQED